MFAKFPRGGRGGGRTFLARSLRDPIVHFSLEIIIFQGGSNIILLMIQKETVALVIFQVGVGSGPLPPSLELYTLMVFGEI